MLQGLAEIDRSDDLLDLTFEIAVGVPVRVCLDDEGFADIDDPDPDRVALLGARPERAACAILPTLPGVEDMDARRGTNA
jgi:hypothetical protein